MIVMVTRKKAGVVMIKEMFLQERNKQEREVDDEGFETVCTRC